MQHIEPLELKISILEKIDEQIIAIGKGVRRFPFVALEIQLFAFNENVKGAFKVAFIENKMLENEIRDFLKPRCENPEILLNIVIIEVEDTSQYPEFFEIIFISEIKKPKETDAFIEVIEGMANCKKLRLKYENTYIGRCEIVEAKGRKVIRKNDLFFLEPREFKGKIHKELIKNETINQSVSRMHGHIRFNKSDGTYFVYDDGSRKGTTLLRGGRGIAQPVDKKIGKELKDGDEICFGKTKVKFRLIEKKKITV